jgi:hypothetical protein
MSSVDLLTQFPYFPPNNSRFDAFPYNKYRYAGEPG